VKTVGRMLVHVVIIICFVGHTTGCYSYATFKQLGSCNPAGGVPVEIRDHAEKRPVVSWAFESRAHHEYGGTRRRRGTVRLKAKVEGCRRPVVYAVATTSGPPVRVDSSRDLQLPILPHGAIRASLPEIWQEDCGLILAAETLQAETDTQKVRLIAVNRHGQVVASKRMRAPLHGYVVLPAYFVADIVMGCFFGVVLIVTLPWTIYKGMTNDEAPMSTE